ncbi:MAG: hypothetical protein ACR2L1_02995 [Pyrinomonadaceae bacterium]
MRKNYDFSKGIRGKYANEQLEIVGDRNNRNGSEEIQKQIADRIQEIRLLRKKEKEEKLIEAKKKKPPLRSGRPRIKTKLLEEARELAKTNPIAFVAFKTDISVKTLNRYGITRNNLNKEMAANDLKTIRGGKVKNNSFF